MTGTSAAFRSENICIAWSVRDQPTADAVLQWLISVVVVFVERKAKRLGEKERAPTHDASR